MPNARYPHTRVRNLPPVADSYSQMHTSRTVSAKVSVDEV